MEIVGDEQGVVEVSAQRAGEQAAREYDGRWGPTAFTGEGDREQFISAYANAYAMGYAAWDAAYAEQVTKIMLKVWPRLRDVLDDDVDVVVE